MEEAGNSADSNPQTFVRRVTFRLLCHVNSIGGLIGTSGTIIKNLESKTGAIIRISKGLRNCHERVIRITAGRTVDRKIRFDFEQEFDVSEAQVALVRVFERILEVEDSGDGMVGCRLLAHVSQIGAVLGKEGKVVAEICKQTGTRLKVFSNEQLPPCAFLEDELIQIMGKPWRVKKALVSVSSCLQDRPALRTPVNTSFHGDSAFVRFIRPPLDEWLTGDVEGFQESPPGTKIVFRLLCSSGIVRGVIGTGGTIIRTIENETGASIRIAGSGAGCTEQVAIISAFEEPELFYSPAQLGLIRVFSRCVDVNYQKRTSKPFSGKMKIKSRLLIPSNQVDYLIDEVGNVAIKDVDNVEIQLLAGDLVPICASNNDNVVQITGSYDDVKSVLFQLTSRIRENIFSSEVCDGIEKSMAAGVQQLSDLSLVDKETNTEEIILEPRDPHSQQLRSFQTIDEEDTYVDLREYGCGSKVSLENDVQKKTTVEVVVPEELFSSLYGEIGNNLDCIRREILGEKLEAQEPCPGKHDGKVTTTGMPSKWR